MNETCTSFGVYDPCDLDPYTLLDLISTYATSLVSRNTELMLTLAELTRNGQQYGLNEDKLHILLRPSLLEGAHQIKPTPIPVYPWF